MRLFRAWFEGAGSAGGWLATVALVCASACAGAAALALASGGTELRDFAALGPSGFAGVVALTFGVVAAMGAIALVSGAFVLSDVKLPAPARVRVRPRR